MASPHSSTSESRPAPKPAEIAAGHRPPATTGGCKACPISRYCARYEPDSVVMPPTCPFGPGAASRPPAARRLARRGL